MKFKLNDVRGNKIIKSIAYSLGSRIYYNVECTICGGKSVMVDKSLEKIRGVQCNKRRRRFTERT